MKNNLFQFFRSDKERFDDIFEQTRYLLSFRITLYLSIALSILSVILFLYFSVTHSYLTIIGLLLSMLSFYYIRKTGKYRFFMLWFNIFGAFLCVFTLYYVKDQPRIVDALWMLMSSILSFYTLGKLWGLIISTVHAISLSVFYFFFLNEQIVLIKLSTPSQLFAFGVNIVICFSIIIYLLWQNIHTNKLAQEQLKNAKSFLEEQFEVINQQNEEKTVLLKEIHHRVKNNLQVIVSLLRLQLRDITDKDEISKFNESINRVMAMSLIHEKIYTTEDFSEIDLKDYFNTLAKDMISSYQVDKNISLNIECQTNNIGLRPIVPLALIFNELFSNSIKYAFDHVVHPHIEVNLINTEGDRYEFTYLDNGSWKAPIRENSFGLELIETLCDQLDGSFERKTDKGTKYLFHFDKLNA